MFRNKPFPVLLVVFVAQVFFSSCHKDKTPLQSEPDSQWIVDTTLIHEMVAQVDSERIWQNMLHLTSYPDRSNFNQNIDLAGQWLFDYMTENGYTTNYHRYVYYQFYDIQFTDPLHGWMLSGGPYDMRTQDGGQTWQAIDIPIGTTFFINENIGYLTADQSFAVAEVFMSTSDGGITWQIRNNNFGGDKLYFINENTGWLINDRELYGTNDGGVTWQLVNSFNQTAVNIFARDTLNLWVSSWNGVFISHDGGVSWVEVTIGPGYLFFDKIKMLNKKYGMIYSTTEKIFTTSDGGLTWSEVSELSDIHIKDIAITKPSNYWVLGWNGLYFSPDTGKTWTMQNNREWGNVSFMSFIDSENGWISNKWGVYKTNDAGKTTEYQIDNIPFECTFKNIVAEKKGVLHPEKEILVIGHFDTVSDSPGADDNASGVCALLEIGDILKDYNFDKTLKFIFFSSEEIGTIGSNHYSNEAGEIKNDIQAVLNFDAIAYWQESLPKDLNIIYNSHSEWLADSLILLNKSFVNTGVLKTPTFWSTKADQARFWDEGFSAVWFFEAGNNSEVNPYMHSQNDVISNIRLQFLFENIKYGVSSSAVLTKPVQLINSKGE